MLDFYTDERAKLLFKANLCHMATRVNSITGVPYKEDPTIFYWDILNEPRYEPFLCRGWAGRRAGMRRQQSALHAQHPAGPSRPFRTTCLPERAAPACPGKTLSEVGAGWAEEMVSFLKCVDPNHLIYLGTEGFFGETDSNE